MAFMNDPNPLKMNLNFERLELAFGYGDDQNLVEPKIQLNNPQGCFLAMMAGRRRIETRELKKARFFLQLVANSSASEQMGIGFCGLVQVASMLTGYPESVDGARQEISNYHKRMDSLLDLKQFPRPDLGLQQAQQIDANAELFCFATSFYHEIYLDADLRATTGKLYMLKQRTLPESTVVAKWLKGSYKISSPKHPSPPEVASSASGGKAQGLKAVRKNKKLRVGVASAMFQPSSVSADFCGVLKRLSRCGYSTYCSRSELLLIV
jgi:hypothetical protein